MKRFLIGCLMLISCSALASPLSLYQNPDAKSNVIATVKEGQAVVPIYTKGSWVKIGDPTNGNVGWVSKEMLQKSGYPQMSVQISGSHDPKQAQKIMQRIQQQQEEFQASISHYMKQNIENMTQLNQNLGELWAVAPGDPSLQGSKTTDKSDKK